MSTDVRLVVAVFDFDGTLTFKDSFLPFLYWTHGRICGNLKLSAAVFWMLAYLLRLISNHRMKEILLTRFYRGWPLVELQQAADGFAREYLPGLLNPVALERLHWHRRQGHRIVLASANLEIYLQPWGEQLGIEQADLLATRMAVRENKITGKLEGHCCYGPEKLVRLEALLGALDRYCLYVYGDSGSDREILAVADYPYYRHFTAGRGLWIR